MKKITFLSTIAATFVLLAGSPTAKAVNLGLDAVTPLDTFSFEIDGVNTASGVGYTLGSALTGTFGVTQTFTGVGYNGQNYTVTSSEVIGATSTTDTFTVSTPTNFLTSATINGATITGLSFNLGGSNPVSFLTPISPTATAGSIIYNTSTTFALTPSTVLTSTGTALSAIEGVNSGTTAISTLAVRSFTYSVTYASVPEPSTWAMMGLGLVAGAVVIRRRRLAA